MVHDKLRGYAARIADDIEREDAPTLALVEELMRDQTGTLDHLSSAEFARLARQAYDDARAWDTIGAINGYTLADYCTAHEIPLPPWAVAPKEYLD